MTYKILPTVLSNVRRPMPGITSPSAFVVFFIRLMAVIFYIAVLQAYTGKQKCYRRELCQAVGRVGNTSFFCRFMLSMLFSCIFLRGNVAGFFGSVVSEGFLATDAFGLYINNNNGSAGTRRRQSYNKRVKLEAQPRSQNTSLQARKQTQRPLLRVGLIADIQYSNIPDGTSFTGTPRFYRNALSAARTAAQHFEREKLPIVLNLGDIVDGKCQDLVHWGGDDVPDGLDPGLVCTDDVLDALSHYRAGKMIHAYGNHCLYNMDRETMGAKLGIPFFAEPCGELVGYHTVDKNGVRFVVLDCYDISKMRRPTTSSKYQEADQTLRRRNPNYSKNENSPEGLQGLDRRFVAFNGGVGPTQLAWLKDTLEAARGNQERVVLVSHLPLMPGSSGSVCLLWNHAQVLELLRDYRDVIAVSLAGHAHKGGYRRDTESGIHFRVVEAVLENPSPYDTYAVMEIYADRIEIHGFGNCTSAEYDLGHLVNDDDDSKIDNSSAGAMQERCA
eukprot:scaffold1068_cov167-Amphora_coffeaeformis.AAC.20